MSETPPSPLLTEDEATVIRRLGCATCELWFVLLVLSLFSSDVHTVRGWNPEATRLTMNQTQQAIAIYQARHHGQLPADLSDTAQYLPDEKLPLDAWGNPIAYQVLPGRQGYIVHSMGADGLPGGTGLDEDIRVVQPTAVEGNAIQ